MFFWCSGNLCEDVGGDWLCVWFIIWLKLFGSVVCRVLLIKNIVVCIVGVLMVVWRLWCYCC